MLSPCLVFWLHNKMGLFHVLFLLFVACEGKVKNVSVKAVFTFGDSIVDQGNNNHIITFAKCNFEPYGKDFMDGNKPTGRFSNAKTPSDLIVDELGIKELMPAYLDPNLQAEDLKTGVSFASGGCGFDPQTAIIAYTFTDLSSYKAALPLSTQLDHFREYIGKLKELVGEEEANDILSNSLFLVVAGSDDLANTYFTIGIRRLQYDLNAYTNLIVDGASDFVQGLYKLGAKNIAVFGIPPIGCLPAQRTLAGGLTRECATEYNQAAQIANTKLSAAINWLSKTLLQSKLALIDLYNPVLDLIGNPQKHGFEVVDKGCCGTGTIEAVILCNKYSGTCEDDTKYLFWDSYHPTERGYRILVDQFLKKYIDILT